MNDTYEQLRKYIFTLDIIDTHEHLPAREASRPANNDILSEYLGHYFCCDLISAGLKISDFVIAINADKPLAKRWKLLEPYWEAARNTGYGRSLDIAARDLYGFDRIDAKTIAPLNEAFLAARSAGGTYKTVLQEKSKIRVSIVDSDINCDRKFFRSTIRLDDFIVVCNQVELDTLAKSAGMTSIHTLSDLEDACEKVMDDTFKRGVVCLKSGLAYKRSLRYDKPTTAEAERQFDSLKDSRTHPRTRETVDTVGLPMLQDHMMHHICRLADKRGLTFEIHTGLQEGNGNYISNSDPVKLTNLFMEYHNIKFDLFHIGYPYQQTLSALAKNFQNVFIDFAWAHIISPTASVNALVEYLDAVPANKISGFGGDYMFVDGVYGHQYIARENIARALAIKVDQGVFDIDRAMELARMILHDNPMAIFNLSQTLKKSPAAKGKSKRRA